MVRAGLAALAAATALAQPPAPDPLADLKARHAAAENAYFKAVETAGARDADRLWKDFDREQGELFNRAVALAMTDPKSDRALDALEWVLGIPRAYYLDAGLPAFDLATTFHATNPKIARAAATVARYTPNNRLHLDERAAAIRFLNAVAAKNPDRSARGQAVSGLAYQALCRFAVAEYERSKDTDRLAAEAEAIYEKLARDYSDCPALRGGNRTLGDVAQATLHELRTLRVGKKAPDIVGEDLDGKRFKLSDSRGKVTLLVFWGTWCGPCMALVPHERKLSERFRDKPFVIVGVNSDEDRAAARATAAREKMTWRSFWNGPDGPNGPISQTWNVHGWPTVYVLDAAGVIRFRDVYREGLDRAVEELVAELEKK